MTGDVTPAPLAPSKPVGRSKGQRKHALIFSAPLFPGIDIAFAASDKGVARLESTYGVDHNRLSRPSEMDAVALTEVVRRNGDSNSLILITVKMDLVLTCEDYSWIQLAGLCTHEATHAFEAICERIGENTPGEETRAYYVQWIAEKAMQFFWDRFREPLVKTCGTD